MARSKRDAKRNGKKISMLKAVKSGAARLTAVKPTSIKSKSAKLTVRRKKTSTKPNNFDRSKTVKNILITLIILVILAAAYMLSVYLSHKDDVLARADINATMNISDYIGFNLDKDKVHFGTLFPGGTSTRDVAVTSSNDGYVYVTSEEGFENVVFVFAQNIPIQQGTEAMINFVVKPPRNMPEGDYEIPLHIYVLKKKASCFTKTFLLQGTRVKEFSERIEPIGSAKVMINITRPENISPS